MPQIVPVSQPQEVLTPTQKAFRRLQQKIERLQKKLVRRTHELDEGLTFYKETLWHTERGVAKALHELILNFYKCFKSPKFSKQEHAILKRIILNKIDDLFSLIHPFETDEKIRLIFQELEGVSCEEVMADSFDQIKQEITECFQEHGVKLDLSQINAADKEEVLIKKMMEAANNAMESEQKAFPQKPKSKKQIEKEKKAKELEELQQKGLGSIYRKLVKVFHPDLEQDHKLKVEKEELMKNLTTAYERKDLYALLSLQLEWINREGGQKQSNSEEQLKIYNSVLKDQIKELEERIDVTHLDPKYFPIQHYFSDEILRWNSFEVVLRMAYLEMKDSLRNIMHVNAQLRDRENVSYVRGLIKGVY